MNRQALERLTSLLAERIGASGESAEDRSRIELLRRQVSHAVTGMDAYLSAVEAGSSTVVGLREQALDLWQGLERIASAWPEPGTGAAASAAEVRVPAQAGP
ncbi:hypothetical protein [Streptomyces sp. NRRL S-350]|uniref:hypothetical protein n=1 Tax=Streptomyces sp. NRRL S-350 TaxID=1463902 RepID=UPI00131EC730|nr:hypothetical protein [Streptomyces sp. NRRL S-350]